MSHAGKIGGGQGHAHKIDEVKDKDKPEDKENKVDKPKDEAADIKPSDKGVPDFRDDWRRYDLNGKYDQHDWGHLPDGEHGRDDERGHKGEKKKEEELAAQRAAALAAQQAAQQAAEQARQEAAQRAAAQQEQVVETRVEMQKQEEVKHVETVKYETKQYEKKNDAKKYEEKQYQKQQVANNSEEALLSHKKGEGLFNRFTNQTDELEVVRERFQQGKPPEAFKL